MEERYLNRTSWPAESRLSILGVYLNYAKRDVREWHRKTFMRHLNHYIHEYSPPDQLYKWYLEL